MVSTVTLSFIANTQWWFRPAVIPFVHDLVMLGMEVQKQELFQNLTCSNETERPSFLSWCELRKWKLIQLYGLSYTRGITTACSVVLFALCNP